MKLNVRKTIYVGIAFLIISMFWQVYDNIIVKMLVNTFGLNQFWSGVVMALDNILALFLLPLFGSISDKTKSKFGRRTPYIVIGVIVSAILFLGVAIVDSWQLKIIEEEHIPIIETRTEIIDGKEVKGYYFDYEGVSQKFFKVKEDAEKVRAEVVFEITKKHTTNLILFIIILFFVLIAMAIYRTPAVSLMPDVTLKPLRSKANAIINFMGAVGGIISLVIMNFLAKDFNSYVLLFSVISALMIILLVVFILNVNEPKLVQELEKEMEKYNLEDLETIDTTNQKLPKDVRKSFLLIMAAIIFWFMGYNAATTKFSIYAQTVLDMGFTLPLMISYATAIICFIPIGIIASKIGRRKTILIGIVILIFAFLLGSFATSSTKFLIYLTMAFAGIGWSTINVNSYPMVVEMSKGSNVGKYTGYYYSASMSAQIITPILSGYIMDLYGMKTLFPYAIIFCIFAFLSMFFVKHGDSKPIPKLEDFEFVD